MRPHLPRFRHHVRVLFAALTLVALLTATAGAEGYVFPSTNAANAAAGHPHVATATVAPGEVALTFVNPTNSLAFFEYRIDGAVLTSGTAHPVVVGDVIHPGVCVDSRTAGPAAGCTASSVVVTFDARSDVEVRLALGGERDWDFDWTSFAVDPITKASCKSGGWTRWGFANQGACIAFASA